MNRSKINSHSFKVDHPLFFTSGGAYVEDPGNSDPIVCNVDVFTLGAQGARKNPLTYNKALSSFGLLNNSNPPSFHSPDGDKKIELMQIFP